MTNELEKQFFQCFGIEQRHKCTDGALEPCDEQCNECGYYELRYPQITDSILLELTAIHSCWCLPRLCCFNVEQLKEQVLSDLTLFNDKRIELIHQVRTLFEEG